MTSPEQLDPSWVEGAGQAVPSGQDPSRSGDSREPCPVCREP